MRRTGDLTLLPGQVCQAALPVIAAIDSLESCEKPILVLRLRGILFALDDFGKGQSSFG